MGFSVGTHFPARVATALPGGQRGSGVNWRELFTQRARRLPFPFSSQTREWGESLIDQQTPALHERDDNIRTNKGDGSSRLRLTSLSPSQFEDYQCPSLVTAQLRGASSKGFLPLVPLVTGFPHRRSVCNGFDVVMIPAGISREEILVFASPYPCTTLQVPLTPSFPPCICFCHTSTR